MDQHRPVHRYRALEKWIANKVRSFAAQQPDTVALLSSRGMPAEIINLIFEMLVPHPVIPHPNDYMLIGSPPKMFEGVRVPPQSGGRFESKNDDGTYTCGRWCLGGWAVNFGICVDCPGDGPYGTHAHNWRPISREWLQRTDYNWSDLDLKGTALLHAVFFDVCHQERMRADLIAQENLSLCKLE